MTEPEKSIAVIHGIQDTVDEVGRMLVHIMPNFRAFHLYDQFLAWEPGHTGLFSKNNLNRLYLLVKAAELTGANAVLLACSTPCLYAEAIRPFCAVPVVGILDAAVEAVTGMEHGKVGILSTSRGSSDTMLALLEHHGIPSGLEIERIVCRSAFDALQTGDRQRHDRLVLEQAEFLRDYSLVALTQLSCAPLQEATSGVCGCPVLLAGRLCFESLGKFLR